MHGSNLTSHSSKDMGKCRQKRPTIDKSHNVVGFIPPCLIPKLPTFWIAWKSIVRPSIHIKCLRFEEKNRLTQSCADDMQNRSSQPRVHQFERDSNSLGLSDNLLTGSVRQFVDKPVDKLSNRPSQNADFIRRQIAGQNQSIDYQTDLVNFCRF
jgi:hypothetical protein